MTAAASSCSTRALPRRMTGVTEQVEVAGFAVAVAVMLDEATGRPAEIQLNRAGEAKGRQLDLLLDELGLRLSRALQGRRADRRPGKGGRQQRLKLSPIAGMRGWQRARLGSLRLPPPEPRGAPVRLQLDLVVALDAGGAWRDLRLMTNGDADPGLRRVVGELAPVLLLQLRRLEAEAAGGRS